MLVLYIVGAVIALLLLLSLLPLSVTLRVGTAQKFDVSVRFCGVPISTKRSNEQDADKAEKKTPPLSVSEGLALVRSAMDRLAALVRRCRVTRCDVRSVSVGEDAAIRYGEICATVYPFVGYLQTCHRLRKRNTHLAIGWDYDGTDTVAEVAVTVRVRLLFLAAAVLPLLLRLKKQKGESV